MKQSFKLHYNIAHKKYETMQDYFCVIHQRKSCLGESITPDELIQVTSLLQLLFYDLNRSGYLPRR
jgi:hypothetical protein